MYVGVAWVCPWMIALEGEYITLTIIWWYACYYISVDFMYVGVAWICPWLIEKRLHKVDPYMVVCCYYIRANFMYFA